MAFFRCFFFSCFLLVCCIVYSVETFAQEGTAPIPDTPQVWHDSSRSNQSQPVSDANRRRLDGRKARFSLLSQVSSKSPSGSPFMAKLEDPVELDGNLALPKGTLVEGHLETTPARRMMRRGALRMVFDRIRLPDGKIQPARFELTATESDSAKTDNEGTVHPTVSKKRLAIQLGGTALIAKLADDLSEEALATSVGSARWYGLAASTTFLLLQKGREVRLKPGEIIEVDFLRDGSAMPMGTIR
jgi:hypothetical protein